MQVSIDKKIQIGILGCIFLIVIMAAFKFQSSLDDSTNYFSMTRQSFTESIRMKKIERDLKHTKSLLQTLRFEFPQIDNSETALLETLETSRKMSATIFPEGDNPYAVLIKNVSFLKDAYLKQKSYHTIIEFNAQESISYYVKWLQLENQMWFNGLKSYLDSPASISEEMPMDELLQFYYVSPVDDGDIDIIFDQLDQSKLSLLKMVKFLNKTEDTATKQKIYEQQKKVLHEVNRQLAVFERHISKKVLEYDMITNKIWMSINDQIILIDRTLDSYDLNKEQLIFEKMFRHYKSEELNNYYYLVISFILIISLIVLVLSIKIFSKNMKRKTFLTHEKALNISELSQNVRHDINRLVKTSREKNAFIKFIYQSVSNLPMAIKSFYKSSQDMDRYISQVNNIHDHQERDISQINIDIQNISKMSDHFLELMGAMKDVTEHIVILSKNIKNSDFNNMDYIRPLAEKLSFLSNQVHAATTLADDTSHKHKVLLSQSIDRIEDMKINMKTLFAQSHHMLDVIHHSKTENDAQLENINKFVELVRENHDIIHHTSMSLNANIKTTESLCDQSECLLDLTQELMSENGETAPFKINTDVVKGVNTEINQYFTNLLGSTTIKMVDESTKRAEKQVNHRGSEEYVFHKKG